MQPMQTGQDEPQPVVYEILTSAVTLAKQHQVRTLKALLSMLEMRYPAHLDEIKMALQLWAAYEQRKRRVQRAAQNNS